jgi:hypothetical protein
VTVRLPAVAAGGGSPPVQPRAARSSSSALLLTPLLNYSWLSLVHGFQPAEMAPLA